MSKLVRTILIIVFALFLIGGITAIVLVNRQPEKKVVTKKTTEKTVTTTTTPIAPVTPAPVASPAPVATSPRPTSHRTTIERQIILGNNLSESVDSTETSAWANAWVDANGIAHADAGTN